MTQTEFYAFCLATVVLSMTWLIVGIPGVLCCIAAMIVGNIDLSWIEEKPNDVAASDPVIPVQSIDAGNLDRAVGWKKLAPVGMVKKERRAVLMKRKKLKLPPNVVEFPKKIAN